VTASNPAKLKKEVEKKFGGQEVRSGVREKIEPPWSPVLKVVMVSETETKDRGKRQLGGEEAGGKCAQLVWGEGGTIVRRGEGKTFRRRRLFWFKGSTKRVFLAGVGKRKSAREVK